MIEFLNPKRFRHFPEFDSHQLVARINDPASQLRGFVAIHRGDNRLPALGATRLWSYSSPVYALRDALRVSRVMTYKSVMAGLKYGGAKGVLMNPFKIHPDKASKFCRQNLLQAYAEEVNRLNGIFITGADVGLTDADLKLMRKKTSFLLGFKSQPVKCTAIGLFLGIEVCLKEIFGSSDIEGRTFSIQGLGKIGSELLKLLYRKAGKIFVTDINSKLIRKIKQKFPKVMVVAPEVICNLVVDVYAPCTVSGIITPRVAKNLQAKIVAGGGNEQLANDRAGKILYQRGILYAPDYVINAGGLISVVDELENRSYSSSRVLEKLLIIPRNLKRIFKLSREKHKPPEFIANKLAQKLIKQKFG
jgi:leucine dehydrogenase